MLPFFNKQSPRKTWVTDLSLLSLLIIILFGLFLGSRPLSVPDEARYAEIPREMLASQDFVTPHLNGIKYFEKPPLFYWLQATSLKIFSPNLTQPTLHEDQRPIPSTATYSRLEWATRIPNALLAVWGCVVIYIAGRLLFNRSTGWYSALCLASSLLYFGLAHMVTLDMGLSVFLASSLLSFIIGIRYPKGEWRRNWLYAAYAFSALAVLTKGLVGIVFPALIIGTWILATQQWRLVKEIYLPSGLLLFFAIVLPWHILVQMRNPEFFHFYFIEQQFLRYSTLIAHRYQPNWFFIPIVLVGFLPWTLFLGQALYASLPKKSYPLPERHLLLFLWLWIGLIFVFFSLSHSKLIPYILPIFPALALLTGRYFISYSASRGFRYALLLLPWIWLGIGFITLFWIWMYPTSFSHSSLLFIVSGFSLFLISSIYALFYCLCHRKRMTFLVLVVGSSMSFLLFLMAFPRIDTRSVKPLVEILHPLLQPGDKIVAYETYYQDLPFYLNRRILLVGFRGELDFGLRHQASKNWVLNEAQFWKLWHSGEPMFMITPQSVYQLLKLQGEPVHCIAATSRNVLLSNFVSARPRRTLPLKEEIDCSPERVVPNKRIF